MLNGSLNQTRRLHRMLLGGVGEMLLPEAFVVSRDVDGAGTFRVLMYSPELVVEGALIELLNAPVCLQTQLGYAGTGGGWRSRSGFVKGITHLYSDGSLHYYQCDVVSGISYLQDSVHTRVFHEQSCIDIITSILSDYAPQLQFELLAEVEQHEPATRIHASRTQQNITDWEFVQSLLHDAGLSWVLLESPEHEMVTSLDDVGRHTLTIFSDSSQLPECTQSRMLGGVEFATATLQNQHDTVMQINGGHEYQGSVSVKVVADSHGQDRIYRGEAVDDTLSRIYTRSGITVPTTNYVGTPSRVNSDDAAQAFAEQIIQAQATRQHPITAIGSVRDLECGQHLQVNGYLNQQVGYLCIHNTEAGIEPQPDSHHSQNRRYSHDWLINQLASQDKDNQPDWLIKHIKTHGFIQWMTLLPNSVPYVPYPSRFAIPALYPEQADYQGMHLGFSHSVNGAGSAQHESDVTDDGKVAIQPHWQGHSKHDAGYHLPTRVLQNQHGTSEKTHGWQFLPRQNQELGYQHLYNDPDSPVITAQFYDGIGSGDADTLALTQQSQQPSDNHNLMGGNSPRWHGAGQDSSVYEQDSHQGYVTGVSQYSLDKAYQTHVLMDDNPSQLGLEIQHQKVTDSSGHSSGQPADYIYQTPEHRLDLGTLTHRENNHRSQTRGTGFDAGSDHSSHIQASQGLLITSYKIQHSESIHDHAYQNLAGQSLLKFGRDISKTLSDANRQQLQPNHQIDKPLHALQHQAHDMADKDYPHTSQPHLLIHSRDNFYSSSTNHHIASEQQLTQSGGSQHWISGQDIQLHSDSQHHVSGLSGEKNKDGMKLSANQESLSIQAQGNTLNMDAKGNLQIASQDGQINLASPKEIKLATQGGAAIVINASGITLTCPCTITVKTSKRNHTMGGGMSGKLPIMPEMHEELFTLKDSEGHILANFPYEIETENGEIYTGITDENGKTQTIHTMKPETLTLYATGFDGYMDGYHYFDESVYGQTE